MRTRPPLPQQQRQQQALPFTSGILRRRREEEVRRTSAGGACGRRAQPIPWRILPSRPTVPSLRRPRRMTGWSGYGTRTSNVSQLRFTSEAANLRLFRNFFSLDSERTVERRAALLPAPLRPVLQLHLPCTPTISDRFLLEKDVQVHAQVSET